MIVNATKLQRLLTMHGIDGVLKLAVDTSGALKRLNRSPREADSVTNLVTALKSEVEKVPSHEHGEVAIEVNPDVGKVWMVVLTTYTRRVTRVVKSAGQLELQTNYNVVGDACDGLAKQLQEQLDLPIQSLDSIIAEQEQRERDEDAEFARGTQAGPHRGVGAKADKGLADNAVTPADPRNRRGAKPAQTGKKWDRTHFKKGGKKGDKRQTTLDDQPKAPVEPAPAETQEHRDGPASKDDVVPLKVD